MSACPHLVGARGGPLLVRATAVRDRQSAMARGNSRGGATKLSHGFPRRNVTCGRAADAVKFDQAFRAESDLHGVIADFAMRTTQLVPKGRRKAVSLTPAQKMEPSTRPRRRMHAQLSQPHRQCTGSKFSRCGVVALAGGAGAPACRVRQGSASTKQSRSGPKWGRAVGGARPATRPSSTRHAGAT